MNKKQKFKEYWKDLFYSIFKTTNLFKFAIYSWITPLMCLIVVSLMMIIPPIRSYNSLKIEDITSNVLYVDKAMSHLLSKDIKCSISDKKLICDEDYSYETLYEFKNNNDDTIKYKIYVNSNVSDVDFSVGKFGEHFDTDNYIILFETTFVYRYTYHNPKNESVNEYKLYGFYDKLDGLNLHDVYTNSLSSDDQEAYLLEQSNYIILNGYKGAAYEAIFTNIVANIGFYLIFIVVTALLIKGNFLLKKNKGFKYTQSLKISFVASLQAATIAIVLSLFGMDFVNMFGLLFVVRILYIYIRYTGSKKNIDWLNDLYKLTNDERYKI